MVRRPGERTGRQTLTNDTKRVVMMDTCPPELERHLVLKPDRYDTHPKVKSAMRDHVEQMRHKLDPMDIGDVTWHREEDYEDEWEEVQVSAAPRPGGLRRVAHSGLATHMAADRGRQS